ncbi:unnamed protein product [Cladocopium goreaui]|uniref:Uncharacterized protein n=1 Tax=Cladocopium goreaui TaxID=2562237 RepID=A0A9P1CWD6_9DINO|nr:unnamed protein product [Cladocopium goreaui]
MQINICGVYPIFRHTQISNTCLFEDRWELCVLAKFPSANGENWIVKKARHPVFEATNLRSRGIRTIQSNGPGNSRNCLPGKMACDITNRQLRSENPLKCTSNIQ